MTTSNSPVKSQIYISTRFQMHMKKAGLGLFDSSQLFNFIKILFCNSRKYLLVYKNQTRKNRTIYPVCCCQVVVSWFQKKKIALCKSTLICRHGVTFILLKEEYLTSVCFTLPKFLFINHRSILRRTRGGYSLIRA